MEPWGTPAATGPVAMPPTEHPERWQAQRQAVMAAYAQLANGFVFGGLQLAGLSAELGSADSDPHGYAQIFAFLGSVLLLLPALGLAITALALLRGGRRSGGVWLIVSAAFAVLGMVLVITGFAAGPLEIARVLVVGGAVIWLAVSVLCLLAGSRALTRLPAAR